MTSCEAWEEAAGAVLSGDASPEERSAWDSHHATCPACRESFAGDAALLSRVRSIRPSISSVSAPEGLIDGILERTVRRGRVVSLPRRIARWAVPTLGIAAAATLALLVRPAAEDPSGRPPLAPLGAPVTTLAQIAPAGFPRPTGPAEIGGVAPAAAPRARAVRIAATGRTGISPVLWAEGFAEAGTEDLLFAEHAMGEALLDAEALGTKDLIDGLSDEAAESVLEDLKVEA